MPKVKISWYHLRKTCDGDRNFKVDKAEQAEKITGVKTLDWMDNRDKQKAKSLRKPHQSTLQSAWRIKKPIIKKR